MGVFEAVPGMVKEIFAGMNQNEAITFIRESEIVSQRRGEPVDLIEVAEWRAESVLLRATGLVGELYAGMELDGADVDGVVLAEGIPVKAGATFSGRRGEVEVVTGVVDQGASTHVRVKAFQWSGVPVRSAKMEEDVAYDVDKTRQRVLVAADGLAAEPVEGDAAVVVGERLSVVSVERMEVGLVAAYYVVVLSS